MNDAAPSSPSPKPAERFILGLRILFAGAALVLTLVWMGHNDVKQTLLFAIGLGLGATLFITSFGFSAAYRRALVHRDMSGVLAQIAMIALATVLFAPLLASQQASGAWAPVGLQVAVGAFLFGIGMQLGGACASGTLFSVGGGSPKMLITLIFFCLGAFIASLHLGWWGQLPDWGTLSLGHQLGWVQGVALQLVLLAGLAWILIYLRRGMRQSNIRSLIIAASILAVLNTATLFLAGHPWTVTWAFTLWGAKTYQLLGGDLGFSSFWTGSFQSSALNGSLLDDTTSLMNIAVVFGAFVSAFALQRLSFKRDLSFKSILASVIGGLMMGYGARLAYGCNIGALFSAMASTSLHAWLWLPCALTGTWVGIRLRPLFGLNV